jgi:hypothetical protein
MDSVIQRAIEGGDIRAGQVSERVARLPVDLFRHEVLMAVQPISDEVIEEIVDKIFLPLVQRGNRAGRHCAAAQPRRGNRHAAWELRTNQE